MNQTEYEIHLAADVGGFSQNFSEKIYELGFRDDPLVKRGVVFSPLLSKFQSCCPLIGLHVTWDSYDKDQYKMVLKKLDRYLISMQNKYVGYAHAEVIRPEWDSDIKYSPFKKGEVFPFRKFNSQNNIGHSKKWDIHISAKISTLDNRLYSILFEKAGMYYIDLQKKDGVYRIFTIQGISNPQHGRSIYNKLRKFLLSIGGMEGAIKYEQSCYWIQSGDSNLIPPTITTTEDI